MDDQKEQPQWLEGVPSNLAAAAADAWEWLELLERMIATGRWKFGQPNSQRRLHNCREQLARFLDYKPRLPPSWAKVEALRAGNQALADQAVDYLKLDGLQGSPLRDASGVGGGHE